ncbi:putative Transmembrane protein [Quillaja saponaria]|uniref:Transmembrane protein n=1 Tax=Quillaja saponaria TaxID=32244 RepID=A0AAD7LAM3_QUISA|nr:putative Transmembrane protein [Quillaja saponaria]
MNRQLWHPDYQAFQAEWALQEDISTTFLKCISWQVEETLDPTNCPYHYFCDSTYPGNYPPAVDIFVFLFTTASYLVTLVILVMDMISGSGTTFLTKSKRYLLPSGPIFLPVILLVLANGYRINTIFPLSCIGPAIIHLILISALSFDNGADKDIQYVFFAASTISGILHASLYLDSFLLPYYTGFDALLSSDFSGECASCVCRKEVLVVGGKLVSYRGWSVTTFCVVGVLCLRIICRVYGGKAANSVPERALLRVSAFGGIFLLICLHFLKEACAQIYTMTLICCTKHEMLSVPSGNIINKT